jgi:hypothetical protein
MTVGTGQNQRERGALCFDDDVMFWAGSSAIGGPAFDLIAQHEWRKN